MNLYYEVGVVSGDPRPDDDVAELRWFPADGLPGREELAFTTVAAALDAWRELRP